MSKKVKIELNDAGIKSLLKDNSIVGACEDVANEIASKYKGSGKVTTSVKSTRGLATVSTTSQTNELLVAMGKAKKVK